MNNNGFLPYGNFGYGPNTQQPQPMYRTGYPNNSFKTNKIFVTSLQDALSRSTERDSEYVYFHQDLDILYNVRTDQVGRKTYLIVDLIEHKDEPKQAEQNNMYENFDKRLKVIEQKLEIRNGTDEQSNAK